MHYIHFSGNALPKFSVKREQHLEYWHDYCLNHYPISYRDQRPKRGGPIEYRK
jgi:hypothetical protein